MSNGRNAQVRALLSGVSCVAVATLLIGGSAYAQTGVGTAAPAVVAPPVAADTGDEQTIVVRSFRSSLEKAIDLKRLDDNEADSIIAEDIGKFPDLNLSESLQRIPGVAITKDAGEGREISVRGLNTSFSLVRINGMDALSSTGSSDFDGGVNRTRAFDFNVFASDLFNKLTVHKTTDASQEEGALGAMVDMNTARAFDYKKFTLVASAQGIYNDQSNEVAPRVSAMIADTWGDFGALVSLNYGKRKITEEGSSATSWTAANIINASSKTMPLGGFANTSAGAGGYTLAQLDNALIPRIPRYDEFHDDSERKGATASFQWKPSDQTLVNLDAMYSDFSATRQEDYIELEFANNSSGCKTTNPNGTCVGGTAPAIQSGTGNLTVTNATINSQNVMTEATVNGADIRTEERFDRLDTKFSQVDLQFFHEFNDKIKVDAVVGRSESDFTNPEQTTIGWDIQSNNASYNFTNMANPVINFGTAAINNPNAWTLDEVRLRPQGVTNIFNNADFNLTYKPLAWFTTKFGADSRRYTYSSFFLQRGTATSTGNTESSTPAAAQAIPLSSYGQGETVGGVSYATPSVSGAYNALNLNNQSIYGAAWYLTTNPELGSNNSVIEADVGGYAMGSFDFANVLNVPVHGNFGVRIVNTHETAVGNTFVNSVQQEVDANHSYAEVLPSLNIIYEPVPDYLIRMSAGRVMSRPNLTDLVSSTTVTATAGAGSVKTGNPDLNPTLANAYDIAFEAYPGAGSLVSLALFRKDFSSLVQTVTTKQIFQNNTFGIPVSAALAACPQTIAANGQCAINQLWSFQSTTNAAGTSLNGVEVNFELPFRFLPSFLSQTGMLANYTYVDSKENYLNSAGQVQEVAELQGLSRQTFNTTLYYDDKPWTARVSAVYRSHYILAYPATKYVLAGIPQGTEGWDSTWNIDASIQYNVTPQIQLTLQGVNLTDQAAREYDVSPATVVVNHLYGRDIIFGIRYTY